MHKMSIFNCRCRFEMMKIFRATEEIYFYLLEKLANFLTFPLFKSKKKSTEIFQFRWIKNRLLPCTRSLFSGDSEINFNALVIYFRQLRLAWRMIKSNKIFFMIIISSAKFHYTNENKMLQMYSSYNISNWNK